MLRIAARHAHRALSAPRYYGRGLAKVFMTEPVFVWSQAIAFKTLVTLLPLVLLASGIFGLVLRQEEAFTTVSSFLRDFLPRAQSDGLVELVFSIQEASGELTFYGALFFLITVVTLFTALRYVVGAAMGESRHQARSILQGYLFDLRMAAQAGVLFLVSFGMTASVRFVSARSNQMADQVGLNVEVVESVTGVLVQVVSFVVPYLLTVGMLWLLYYLVPRPKPPKRSALAGAAAGAVLFELAKNLFALYATHVANFERYGEGEGLGSVFGLILAFVFWVYFSGFILVIGAVVASLHEKRVHPRKAHLRRMWSRTGRFRRYRERTEAEAAEALANVHRPEGSRALPAEDPPASDGSASGASVPDEGEGAASSVMARRARQRAESATSP